MTALCRATVDTVALHYNLRRIRELSGGAKVLAVIKANAYGHGLVPVAKSLVDADALAVARMEEAVALRAAGVGQRLVLLEGVFNRSQLELAAANACDLVVHSHEQLQLLEAFDRQSSFTVWLKLDTGMNRLGFRPEEFAGVLARLRSLHAVRKDLVLMTHLAGADELTGQGTRAQLELFEHTTRGVQAERSIANSAGLLAWPESRAQWVRPGLALFGVSPLPGKTGEELGLKPVMHLGTELIAIRKVAAGEAVGYGSAWRANRDSSIGVAAIGYGDGYSRHLGNGTPVLLHGKRVPLVGRVSMDMITVDLTDHPQARVGDSLTLWGKGLPVEEIAQLAGTIPYEMLCGVTQRVSVEYLR
ncbi:MAG: alanine racemase [Gammaproteobacteria bacterium]|nr:alanine racemase [Gammaproteobacteria bacterium]